MSNNIYRLNVNLYHSNKCLFTFNLWTCGGVMIDKINIATSNQQQAFGNHKNEHQCNKCVFNRKTINAQISIQFQQQVAKYPQVKSCINRRPNRLTKKICLIDCCFSNGIYTLKIFLFQLKREIPVQLNGCIKSIVRSLDWKKILQI